MGSGGRSGVCVRLLPIEQAPQAPEQVTAECCADGGNLECEQDEQSLAERVSTQEAGQDARGHDADVHARPLEPPEQPPGAGICSERPGSEHDLTADDHTECPRGDGREPSEQSGPASENERGDQEPEHYMLPNVANASSPPAERPRNCRHDTDPERRRPGRRYDPTLNAGER